MDFSANKIMELVQVWGLKAVLAIVIFAAGRIVARVLCNSLRTAMRRARVEETLVSFAGHLSYALLMLMVIIAAINQLGIQTTSFVAILGAAGLAVGLALQGSLANFAAGILMIVFKPFKVDDIIEAAGTMGTVEEIEIFTTKMRTPDNKLIIVPNNQIINGSITNFSAKETRRVDLVVSVSYRDDLSRVKTVLEEILNKDGRILADPAPTVAVLKLGESSIDFAVRPWVKSEDYWPTLFDLNQSIKERFDAEGICIPFPQREVHLYPVKSGAAA